MSKPKILITAATGATGRAATLSLIEAGERVRALAHRDDERSRSLEELGVEVVFGDLNRTETPATWSLSSLVSRTTV